MTHAVDRVVRLANSFECWPTWDHATGDSIDPRELPIPPDLIARILNWDDAFQATFDSAYPPDSRFPDEAAETAWRAEGDAIFLALTEALGADRVTRRGPF